MAENRENEESLNRLLKKIKKMIEKSIATQLAFYGVFIASFFVLGVIDYNTGVVLFDALFKSSKFYFMLIGILLLIPVAVIGGYEFFSSGKSYEESKYNLISKVIIHIVGLILLGIFWAGIFVFCVIHLSFLNNVKTIILVSLIITFLIMFSIWLLKIFYYS